MDKGLPDNDTVKAAIALATRAPSVHNTQPWRWRIGERTVHLYADQSMHLPFADPDRRDLIISCGAALHHLRIALSAMGWASTVHRLPNPAEPNHLAALELQRRPSTSTDVALAHSISERRTDRRRFSSWAVPAGHVRLMIERAIAQGVVATEVSGGSARCCVEKALAESARTHAGDASYRTELSIWSGRHGSPDGVPAANATIAHVLGGSTRAFSAAQLVEAPRGSGESDESTLLLLSTPSDDALSRLRAGEACSAVLLTATTLRLASCPMTEPLELDTTRDMIGAGVLAGAGFPQMLVRVGWAPVSADPLPATPRRRVADIVDPFPETSSLGTE